MESSDTYAEALIPIGEASRLAGASISSLRRWEKDGKLTAYRTPNGHRRYRRSDIEALLKASA